MDTIIKKVKSLQSLKNRGPKELGTQSSSPYKFDLRVVQNLYPPEVLIKRQCRWMDLGKNLEANVIYTAKQQMLVVDVLEELIDVMLEESCVEELGIC